MSARAREEIEALYRAHRDAVYRSLLRELRDPDEAEDATQTTFLQAYRAILRGGRPARPRAWLLTIADNVRRRKFVRARGRPQEVPLDEDAADIREPPEVEELRDALATLPFNQRSTVVLREVAGLSYDDIARQLGTTVGSVQMLLFRARRTLRDQLETAARRASAYVPPSLAGLLQQPERLAPPARVAGVAAAAAIAVVAVGGGGAPPDGRLAEQRSVPIELSPETTAEPRLRMESAAEAGTPARRRLQDAAPRRGAASRRAVQPAAGDEAASGPTVEPTVEPTSEPPPPAPAPLLPAAPPLPAAPQLPGVPPLPDPTTATEVLPEAPAPALPPLPLPVPVPVPDTQTPALPTLP